MKRKIYLGLLMMFFISLNINAQAPQNRNKKAQQIEAIKVGFISGRLNLTDDESSRFWPMYKQYQKEMNQIMQQKKQNRAQNATDANKSIDDDFYFESKMLELKKMYRLEFGKILPPEKVKKLYVAERDFREELIKQLKQKRESGN